jgi:Ca2+-transporting ATPase
VAAGRKIYTNLKKAIQYIISIHIPIILTVFTPLVLGWTFPNIFTPIHVIFMELIMGPTCSIIYENEPMEENAMLLSPRPFTSTFFRWHELGTSILQGLIIAVGTLAIYKYGIYRGYGEELIRTTVFVTLIAANVFLTLVNRSFHFSIMTTFRYRNNLVYLIIAATIMITAALLYIRPLARFFLFESPTAGQLLLPLATGLASVIWYEAVKWKRRHT